MKTETDNIGFYENNGFCVVEVYTSAEVDIISDFAKGWLEDLLKDWSSDKEKYPLEEYHKWFNNVGIDHSQLFKASNRHVSPPEEIKNILVNQKVRTLLREIGVKDFELWDEGYGWLAFRFIRPGMSDGYPFSRKAWGPAKNVVSAWVPIIGFGANETLRVIPGSHVKEYQKYLPEDSKFVKDEYRLLEMPRSEEWYNPELNKGEVIIYDPRLIHSEDVKSSDVTRLNLEFRINPL